MSIEDKVRRPRGVQYQTGPRHGQQLADARKRGTYGAPLLERIGGVLRAFDTARRGMGALL